MLNFVGLIFISGYNIKLSEKDYWTIDPDFCCNAFPDTMIRNRFFELKSFLHAADNHSLSDSRMTKVEPLHNLLNQKLQAYGIFHEDLSIDESMVLHYGCHSCKQIIRAKPIRFGCKFWVLASAIGLPYNVEIYAGKSANDTDESLGTRVVKNAFEVSECQSNHSVYFDNFFSNYQLLSDFDKKVFRAIGIMRKDCVMKFPLIDMKQMKRKERGSYDYRSDGKIEIIWWNDNLVITLENIAYSVEPLGTVKRWIKGIAKSNVNQPALITAYNQGM